MSVGPNNQFLAFVQVNLPTLLFSLYILKLNDFQFNKCIITCLYCSILSRFSVPPTLLPHLYQCRFMLSNNRNVSRCCPSTCTFSYQNYRGEPRNGLQAFSPQGGESSGLVGMCLARLKSYRPASQGNWEPIGQEAALSRALVWAGLS